MPQIQEMFDRISEYSLLDSEELLPHHRHLLEINFVKLGSDPPLHCFVISDWNLQFQFSKFSIRATSCPKMSHISL